MLDSLLELKDFCIENSATLPGLKLSAARWNALSRMCAALKPMADLTTQLQYEDLDVTQMVAYWKSAMFMLQRLNTPASRKLRKWIEPREKAVFSNKIVVAAMYIDKRFSLTLTQAQINIAKDFIRGLVAKKARVGRSLQAHPAPAEEEEEDSDDSIEIDDFDAYMGSLSGPSDAPPPTVTIQPAALEDEFVRLEALRRLPAITVMKEFWSSIDKFPVIKSIVFDLIAVPMTEVSAERLFSHLNFILNKNRSCLKDLILDAILFLRMNGKFTTNEL